MSQSLWNALQILERERMQASTWKIFAEGEDQVTCMMPDDQSRNAYFGFWNFQNSAASAHILKQAQLWSQAQGAHSLIGPYNYSTFFDYRLKLNGFDQQGYIGEPRTTKPQLDVLESMKFEIVEKYSSNLIHLDHVLKRDLFKRVSQLMDKGSPAYRYEALTLESFHEKFYELYELTSKIFSANAFYTPVSFASFQLLFLPEVLNGVCWKTSRVMLTRDNHTVGYVLNFKDASNPHNLFIKTLGVHPDHRQMGLSFLALIFGSLLEAIEFDYTSALVCLMRVNNPAHKLTRRYSRMSYEYGLFGKLVEDLR
jgi:hypothetical protein